MKVELIHMNAMNYENMEMLSQIRNTRPVMLNSEPLLRPLPIEPEEPPTLRQACEDLRAEVKLVLEELQIAEINRALVFARGRSKKAIIIDIVFYSVLASMILFAGIFGWTHSHDDEPTSFLGYSFMDMLTPSMQSTIPVNSLVITKQVDPGSIEIGDDISFYGEHEHTDFTITHRVIDIIENYDGMGHRGFVTQGTDNAHPDPEVILPDDIIGKVVFHSAFIGGVLMAIKTHIMLSLEIFLVIVALIAGCVYFFKFRHRISKKQAVKIIDYEIGV